MAVVKWFNKLWRVAVALGVIVGLAVGLPQLFCEDDERIIETVTSEPRFSVRAEYFEVCLGGDGVCYGYERSELEAEPDEPFSFCDYKPVRVYIDDGDLYADVEIYAGAGLPPIKMEHNQLQNKPPDWDVNFSDTALEVVNEAFHPMYQFIYESDSKVVVKGIFPFPGGLVLATEKGIEINPELPVDFHLDRIFKYPSWQYSGQYKD